MNGLVPGDLLEIAVLAIDTADPACQAPLSVTLTLPGGGTAPVQTIVPAGSVVRLRATRPGGPIAFGPPLAPADPGRFGSGVPLAGQVTARYMIVPAHRG